MGTVTYITEEGLRKMKDELERLPTLHRLDLVDFQRVSLKFSDYAKRNAILL